MSFLKENKQAFNFLLEILKEHKGLIIKYFIFIAITSCFWVILPYIAKLEIDQLSIKNNNLFWIIKWDPFYIFWVILAIILLINLIKSIIDWFVSWFDEKSSSIIELSIKKRSINYIQNIKMWFFLNKRNQRVLWDLSMNMHQLSHDLRNYISKFFSNIISFGWIIIVFSFINYKIWLIIIVSLLIFHFINKYNQKIVREIELKGRDHDYKNRRYSDQIDNTPHLLFLSWGYEKMAQKTIELINERIQFDLSSKKIWYLIWLFRFLNSNISSLIIKLIVWYSIFKWTWSIWLMTMTMMYVDRIQSFFIYVIDLKDETIKRIDKIKMLQLFIDLTKANTKKEGTINSLENIAINNLYFKYPNISEYELKFFEIHINRLKEYSWNKEYLESEMYLYNQAIEESKVENPLILKWINATFEKWKIYWIVWKNWAWKTTLINIILDLFDNYEWEIYFSNKELKTLSNSVSFENIWIITQIPYILPWLTVKENILLWVKNEVGDEIIIELLKEFKLDKKINKFRKWLDTELMYDADLSWWEKQLIVLIRAILQDKSVIILDEWTNQLDADNELLVMNKLLANKKDKIIIFITHRMTTIRKADLIYCLEDGVIVNSWNHNDLVWKDNIYSKFWYNQVIN